MTHGQVVTAYWHTHACARVRSALALLSRTRSNIHAKHVLCDYLVANGALP